MIPIGIPFQQAVDAWIEHTIMYSLGFVCLVAVVVVGLLISKRFFGAK